ncbi:MULTISPECIES: hypothetical protein [Cobetia]|uniref:hypothetical protein n=1 Tax=Cobetia TaxID=204286 RepID=UPI001582DF96|nr:MULTISPECIES: hypothetical protein [Cobetia]MDI4659809.1 hypothetical protein [Cobetia sp. BMC6]NUJ55216.1 hypothetical protein [Cobetia marina]
MHDAIREAHELIGATLRDPRTQREGKVVGMDLGREQPAIYVLWQESAAAERIGMEPDDFRALLEHLRARLPVKAPSARQDKDSRQSRRHKRKASRATAQPAGESNEGRSGTPDASPSGSEPVTSRAASSRPSSSALIDDAMPRSAQG